MSVRWKRIVNLLVAGVFLSTVGGDTLGTHDCPHHDGLARHAAATPPVDMAGAHGGHADRDSSGSHDGPCTCVGQCNVAGGLAVIGIRTAQLPRVATLTNAVRRAPAAAPAKAPTPYLIPFANAPPA
jgi:hypothetical protein